VGQHIDADGRVLLIVALASAASGGRLVFTAVVRDTVLLRF
jgi:hypothetical protein